MSPSFPIPPDYAARSIDLNRDGAPDFSFWSSGPICPADDPTSFCSWPYSVGTLSINGMLVVAHIALLQSFGAEIGSNAPLGAAWSRPFFGVDTRAVLTAEWWSRDGQVINGQLVYNGWSGSLGDLGIAYLGVRFYPAGGFPVLKTVYAPPAFDIEGHHAAELAHLDHAAAMDSVVRVMKHNDPRRS